MDFVELVKRHARTEKLQATIGGFLTLMEDVSIYAAERAESTKGTGMQLHCNLYDINHFGIGRTLRGLLDSREQNKTRMLLSRFERLRAELDIGIGAETHKKVHMIGMTTKAKQSQGHYGLTICTTIIRPPRTLKAAAAHYTKWIRS